MLVATRALPLPAHTRCCQSAKRDVAADQGRHAAAPAITLFRASPITPWKCGTRPTTLACAARQAEYDAFNGFDDGRQQTYAVGVMGDLHLEPGQMHLFHEARDQILSALQQLAGSEDARRVVQLGDLGGYSCAPGSQACFDTARQFLSGFQLPAAIITGNHDLEGADFESDELNLAAWKASFSQDTHYWAKRLGNALLIGLSTVRFRSNDFSVHEVFIDEEQMAWFKATLALNTGRPVCVFTHAPPAGCGLKVIHNVHVKNRCAWLNHSSNPGDFLKLLQQHENIRLWFSGHFHLSQNYADSISVVGRAAFVQTGVIGECNRDGLRQSRILQLSATGYEVHTINHNDGSTRLDLEHAWEATAPPEPFKLEEEQECDPEAGYVCALDACELADDWRARKTNADGSAVRWIVVGEDVLLAHQDGMLVEYSASLQAPMGAACLDTAQRTLRIVDSDGKEVPDEDASAAAALELVDTVSSEVERIERNERGSFFRIFQPNKWRMKKEKEAAMAQGA